VAAGITGRPGNPRAVRRRSQLASRYSRSALRITEEVASPSRSARREFVQRLLDAALDQRELSRPEATRGLEQWRSGQAVKAATAD
jgi:hypothetical protein